MNNLIKSPIKKKFCVMASTRGTDMESLFGKELDADFSLVIVDRECEALEKAKKNKIPHFLIGFKGKTREEFEKEVDFKLEKYKIDFIVLIGFMRLLSSSFVNKWKNKIMNIHPSLLPSFPGMDLDVHKEVLNYGCKITGCTLHFVDEGKDTGPIIIQKTVEISNDETPETLKKKVQESEKEAIVEGISLYANGKIKISGRRAIILD